MLRLSFYAPLACATSLLLSQTALATTNTEGTITSSGSTTGISQGSTISLSTETASALSNANIAIVADESAAKKALEEALDTSSSASEWDSALQHVAIRTNKDGNLTIEVSLHTPEETAQYLHTSTSAARALQQAFVGDIKNDSAVVNAIYAAYTGGTTSMRKAAEQLSAQPNIIESSLTTVVNSSAEVFNVAANRLASLRYNNRQSPSAQTGFSTGDDMADSAMWVQTFGNLTSKDDTSSGSGTSYGYDATTYGLAVGMDTDFTKHINAGLSLAYSKTDVDGNGPSDAQNDINSYQITAYGDYTARYVFVDAMLGYAFNTNDTQRVINFGGLDRIAKGDYNSNQYMAGVKAGLPMHISKDTMLRPALGLSYTRVSTDSYTETGAGGLNQSVTPDDIDVLLGSFDMKLVSKVRWGNGILLPEASIGVNYDFVGDEASATGRYAGGGSTFTVEGAEVEQFGGTLGLGLGYKHQRWTVGVNYDAEIKSDYLSQTGKMEVRYAF